MRGVVLFLAVVAAVAAVPNQSSRIIGGIVTNINQYPEAAILLFSTGTSGHRQACGGVILNNRSIVTVAHCVVGHAPGQWRTRLGSNYAHYGGVVYDSARMYIHPYYQPITFDNDIGIIRTATQIIFTLDIYPGYFPPSDYHINDNEKVYSVGWGVYEYGTPSEPIRHVQLNTVNQYICAERFKQYGYHINDNMLCAGLLDIGGAGPCYGDEGGPLIQQSTFGVIGLYSFGAPGRCADDFFPSVFVRLSQHYYWLVANA